MTSTISNDQLALATSNIVIIDGKDTDYRAIQMKDRTYVFRYAVSWNPSSPKVELKLPRARYSLSHDKPACGAGRPDFYRDFKEAVAALERA